MPKINKIHQDTHYHYLNMYTLDTVNKKGGEGKYMLASRARNADELKIRTRKNVPEAVAIYSLYGENRDRVVLVRQYRFAIDDYIYEFPAGLVEDGEEYHTAAVRELKEETGLDLNPLSVDEIYENPYFTTIGLTDEACATVYGTADGEISYEGQEDTEDIEVVLADRSEVRRILREENVSILCAYMLMHFMKDEKPFAFLEL